MKTCIMLGNGINRCTLSNISWGDLLATIAKKYGATLNSTISFPMQFENLVNQILTHSNILGESMHTKIKGEIIQHLKSANLSSESPHSKLANSADSVITTNYDFLIEQSLDPAFSIESLPVTSKESNNKYNLNNYVRASEKSVYHIHGDLRYARSICLGYEHYAGTLQNLRSAIATKKDIGGTKKPAIICALEYPSYCTNSWAEKFFSENIHIVGLGLTQSEIDIWWLITYRAFLYYSNKFNGHSLINNSITYHDISTAEDPNMKYALENCAVNYKFHPINKKTGENYLQQYINIAEQLKGC